MSDNNSTNFIIGDRVRLKGYFSVYEVVNTKRKIAYLGGPEEDLIDIRMEDKIFHNIWSRNFELVKASKRIPMPNCGKFRNSQYV